MRKRRRRRRSPHPPMAMMRGEGRIVNTESLGSRPDLRRVEMLAPTDDTNRRSSGRRQEEAASTMGIVACTPGIHIRCIISHRWRDPLERIDERG